MFHSPQIGWRRLSHSGGGGGRSGIQEQEPRLEGDSSPRFGNRSWPKLLVFPALVYEKQRVKGLIPVVLTNHLRLGIE